MSSSGFPPPPPTLPPLLSPFSLPLSSLLSPVSSSKHVSPVQRGHLRTRPQAPRVCGALRPTESALPPSALRPSCSPLPSFFCSRIVACTEASTSSGLFEYAVCPTYGSAFQSVRIAAGGGYLRAPGHDCVFSTSFLFVCLSWTVRTWSSASASIRIMRYSRRGAICILSLLLSPTAGSSRNRVSAVLVAQRR